MEQKDQSTTPTQAVANEDKDVEMSSPTETTTDVQEQGKQAVEIPIEGPTHSTDEMNVEEEEEEEVASSSTVAVIDTAAMEKTWEEEFNNLVKRLKNDRPPNAALEETLEILCDEFESHSNAEPLNIKEELTGRLRPRGLYLVKGGYLKQISEAILDRGNLDSDGQDLTYQVGYQILGVCSTFILDTPYVTTLSEAVHALLNVGSTFNGRYGGRGHGASSPALNFFTQFKNAGGYGRLHARVSNRRRPLSLSDVRWAFTLVSDAPADARGSSAEGFLRALEPRLLAVTAEDLRTEPRGTSTELLRAMGALFRRPAAAAAAAGKRDNVEAEEKDVCEMYARCSLHLAELLVDFSGVFEKKHTGLREICYWIQERGSTAEGEEEMARWVKEKGILQRVLHDVSVHAEFVRKSRELISLEARRGCLGAAEVELIWRFCTATNAEDNKNIMLENVAYESARFAPDVFAAFEERFAALPDEAFFANVTLDVICAFASNELASDGACARRREFYGRHRAALAEQGKATPEALEKVDAAIAKAAFAVHPACLERLWAALLDGSAALASGDAEVRAVELFANIFRLAKTVRPEVREKYQSAAAENVKAHTSVWQSLYFLVNSIPPNDNNNNNNGNNINNLELQLTMLNSKYGLLEAFIEECVAFKREADAAEIGDDSAVLPGTRVPYAAQVGYRFDFATRLLSEARQIPLGKQEVGVLWELFVTKARTPSETRAVLKFFSDIAQKSGEVFDKETSRFLFPGMAETFKFRSLGPVEYDFVSYFFMFLNWKEGVYVQSGSTGQWVITDYPKLVGIDVLWRIALETEDEGVGKNAIDAIFGYFASLAEDERPNVVAYKESALERCVAVLSEEAAKAPEAVYDVRVIRALTIVRKILEDFDVPSPHKDLLLPKKKKPNANPTSSSQGALEEKITLRISEIATRITYTLNDVAKSSTAEDILERLARENPAVSPNARLVGIGKKFEGATTLSAFLAEVGKPQEKDLLLYYVKSPNAQAKAAAPGKALPETSVMLKPSTYETLGRILGLPGIASGVCLRILSLLPTDPTLLCAFDSIYENKNENEIKIEWDEIITSGRRLLYVLPVLARYLDVAYPKKDCKVCKEDESDPRKAAWRSSFIKSGGFVRLVKAFNEMDYEKLHQSDVSEEADSKYKSLKYDKGPAANYVKWCYILHDAVRIIAWCITTEATAASAAEALFGKSSYNNDNDNDNIENTFLEQLFRVTKTLATAYNLYDFDFGIYGGIFRGCVEILTTLLRWPAAAAAGRSVEGAMDAYVARSSAAIAVWTRATLVDCACFMYRSSAEGLVLTLAERHRDGPESRLIVQYLLELLPEVSSAAGSAEEDLTSKGENYFNVLNKLLSSANAIGEEDAKLLELFGQVTEYVRARPVAEGDFGKGEYGEDSVLQGLLRLATTLAPRVGAGEAGNRARAALFLEVFQHCLFAAPSAEAKGEVPKCKKEKSRRIAHELLLALRAAGLSEGFVEGAVAEDLQGRMEYLCEADLPRGAFFADGAVRPGRSYSGLYNQGATCYMNSTLQQFFMVPEFRRALLEIDLAELDEKKANVPFFKAIQKLFLAMQESQHVAQKTKKFTRTLGADFNPFVQMDAIEFLGNFIGTIENGVKGTPYKSITDVFTAKMCDEMIPRGCPHVRENVSLSTTIQVDVKGKRSVEESLENWVRGELLEGDNKCTCEACGEKRDTLKRPCFLETPPVLILHLRRFEFSYETFTNFKVNDEFHFPLTLSLHPYTKKGLHEKDNNENNEKTDNDEYELVGVVAHRGTTNSGHYYSFIKERTESGRWFEFNDSSVTPFDTNNLADECFGGSEQRAGTVPKTNNAYILFYKKKSWDSDEKHAREAAAVEALSKNAKKAYNKIWEDNRSFITGIDMCDASFVDLVKKMYVEPNAVSWHAVDIVQKTLFTLMAHIPNAIPHAKAKASTSLQNDDKDFLKDVNAMDIDEDEDKNANTDKKSSSAAKDTGAVSETSDFQLFVDYLKRAYKDVEYAEEFIGDLAEDEDSICCVSDYILEPASKDVRKAYAEIVYTALLALINSGSKEDQTTAGKFIYNYVKLMKGETVEKGWKTFDEYFYLIRLLAESAEYCGAEVKRLALGVMDTANMLWYLASICTDDKDIQKAEKLKATAKMCDKYSSVDISPVAEAAAVFMREAGALGLKPAGSALFGVQSVYSNILTEKCCFTEAAMVADALCGDSAEGTAEFVSGTLRAAITGFLSENKDSKTINSDLGQLFEAFRTEFLVDPARSGDVLAARGEAFGSALIESVLELFDSRDVVEAFLVATNAELVSVPAIRRAFIGSADKWLFKMLFRVFRGRCREEGYKMLMAILPVPEKDLAASQPLLPDGAQEDGDAAKACVCRVFDVILESLEDVSSLLEDTKDSLRPVRPVPIVKMLYQTLRYESQARALFASEHYATLVALLAKLNSCRTEKAEAKYYIVKLLHEAVAAIIPPNNGNNDDDNDSAISAEKIRLAEIKGVVNSWKVSYPSLDSRTGSPVPSDEYVIKVSGLCAMLQVLFDFVHLLGARFGPIFDVATSKAFAEFCGNVLLNPDYAPAKASFARVLPTPEGAPEDYRAYMGKVLEACLSATSSVPLGAALDILEDPATFGEAVKYGRTLAAFVVSKFGQNRTDARFLSFVRRVLDAEATPVEEYDTLMPEIVAVALCGGLSDTADTEAVEGIKGIWSTFLRRDPEYPVVDAVRAADPRKATSGMNKTLLCAVADSLNSEILKHVEKNASENGEKEEAEAEEDGFDTDYVVREGAQCLALLSVYSDSERYLETLTKDACLRAMKTTKYGLDFVKILLVRFGMFYERNLSECRAFNLIMDTAFDLTGDERLYVKRELVPICAHIKTNLDDFNKPMNGLWKVKVTLGSSKTLALLFAELVPEFVSELMGYLTEYSESEAEGPMAASLLQTFSEYGISPSSDGDDDDGDDDDDYVDDSDNGGEIVSGSDSDD